MSSHQTIDLFIFRNVGVKQVQSYPPNIRAPRPRTNQTASHGHFHQQGPAHFIVH